MASILVSPRWANTKKDNLRCSRGDRRRCAGGASFNPPVWLLRCGCQPAESQVSGSRRATRALAPPLRRVLGRDAQDARSGREGFLSWFGPGHAAVALFAPAPWAPRAQTQSALSRGSAGPRARAACLPQRPNAATMRTQRRSAWHLRKDGLVSATSASESTSETSARSRQSRTRLRTALRELRSPSPPAASSHAPTLNSPLAGLCFAASHPQWRSERVHQKDRVMRWEQGEGVRGEGGLRAY